MRVIGVAVELTGKLRKGLRRREPILSQSVTPANPYPATTSGVNALDTPTIESRVTSRANSSSLQPSVPVGRCGSTK